MDINTIIIENNKKPLPFNTLAKAYKPLVNAFISTKRLMVPPKIIKKNEISADSIIPKIGYVNSFKNCVFSPLTFS